MTDTNNDCKERKEGLPAKVFADPEILILGTFPGESSLKAREYYIDNRNRIWSVLAEIYGEPKPENQEQKNSLLKRHHIALWDLFESVDRKTNLDKDIKDGVTNNIAGFLKEHPTIKAILIAGQKAYKEFEKRKAKNDKNLQINVPYRYVPSTSGANTRFDKCKWIDALRQGGNAI
jgi:hypoxanthine-DNA glycosylase